MAIAGDKRFAGVKFRKSPIPPRRYPEGPVLNVPRFVVCDDNLGGRRYQVKPSRGLTADRVRREVGSGTERPFDVGILRCGRQEAVGFDAGTVHQLKRGRRPPEIADREVAVPFGARRVVIAHGSRERRRDDSPRDRRVKRT